MRWKLLNFLGFFEAYQYLLFFIFFNFFPTFLLQFERFNYPNAKAIFVKDLISI